MHVPHTLLSPAALYAVIQEFVSRDGTDHSSIECRVKAVLTQLDSGNVELHIDGETKSCNIISVK